MEAATRACCQRPRLRHGSGPPDAMSIRATYRLQFHAGFTFGDAARLAPYFSGLGISHIYASPIAEAKKGSAHGYDVVDPSAISSERGGAAGFLEMAEALRKFGLGIILDIVPNHMAACLDRKSVV